MPSLHSTEARRSSHNLYGSEVGDLLIRTIDEWNELAATELHRATRSEVVLIFGLDKDKYGNHASFDEESNVIKFNVPLAVSSAGIKRAVPHVMVHENAHGLRSEAIDRGEGYYDYREYLFDGIIDEGLAGLAESMLLNATPTISFDPDEETDQKLLDTLLLDQLYFARPGSRRNGEAKYDRYLFGRPDRLADRGYKLGYYIVAKTALLTDMPIYEAMAAPNDFYREFAEEHL